MPPGRARARSGAGRASYLFNPTIPGIETADAILIVGANPRTEASLLNVRIRKRWRMAPLAVGVIGEPVDLTYPSHYIGAGPESLAGLARGEHSFLDVLKEAKAPLVIVGANVEPGILAAAAALAKEIGAVTPEWNGFGVLHTAAARVGALDLGFVPGAGGLGFPAMLEAGGVDVLFNLGADERDVAPGAFVIYQGTHGDRGASRADVILPGAAYTEKSATWVNTEGRVQMGNRAGFPPGDAREDWAILRALSDVLGHRLPFDSLTALRRALYAAHPHLAAVGTVETGDVAAAVDRLAGLGGATAAPPSPRRSPTSTSPTRSPAPRGCWPSARASPASAPPRHSRSRRQSRDPTMTPLEILGTVLLIVLKSFVLLAALLVFIAYALLADRKIWAAVQLRRGPNVVGPFGLFQSFADLLKFVLKEPVIPAGANKAIYLLAPLVFAMLALSSWAVIPLADGWAIADINVGITYIFAISSLGVYGVIMGGWASNSKYAFLGALRSAAQMISYEVSLGFVIICVLLCAGSLNLSRIVMAQDTSLGLFGWYWLWLFPMFVVFFISALAETNRPPFDLPEAESELVAGYMVEYSSTPYLLFMLGEYVAIMSMCALGTVLFLGGWLSPIPFAPFTWVPGVIWFILKASFLFFLFAMVKSIVPRYRYDQLMRLGWKVFLPISLVSVVVVAFVLKLTGLAPGA